MSTASRCGSGGWGSRGCTCCCYVLGRSTCVAFCFRTQQYFEVSRVWWCKANLFKEYSYIG